MTYAETACPECGNHDWSGEQCRLCGFMRVVVRIPATWTCVICRRVFSNTPGDVQPVGVQTDVLPNGTRYTVGQVCGDCMHEGMPFNYYDEVEKTGGDYYFRGLVTCMFRKRKGPWRVIVENDDGVVHIFSPRQLTCVD
jgi:hypothetical protein